MAEGTDDEAEPDQSFDWLAVALAEPCHENCSGPQSDSETRWRTVRRSTKFPRTTAATVWERRTQPRSRKKWDDSTTEASWGPVLLCLCVAARSTDLCHAKSDPVLAKEIKVFLHHFRGAWGLPACRLRGSKSHRHRPTVRAATRIPPGGESA